MKNFFILIFLTTISLGVYAQTNNPNNTGRISGKVTDAVTKAPVDYATVSIFKQGSTSPFNGGSTDPNGNFKIDNISPGDYKITVDFIGYTKKIIDHVVVTTAIKNIVLGNILLSPIQTQLKNVVISASAPTVENKIDKLVYNPANDLTTQGGVALDVLQKVPMVTVDINGNVELMGNTNIQFLINGKPSTMFGSSISDALQAIPASQIKNIEVITNPGAKYDATGTGGIINIVLKDSKVQGVNGSVNLSAGTRLENGSFNINARKGNFGVSAFFSGNGQLTSTTPSTTNRTSTSGTDTTRLYQKGSSAFKRSGYRSGLNFTWDITPKDELTAAINLNHFGNQSNGIINQNQTTNSMIDTASLNRTSSRYNNNSTDASLYYKKMFAKENQELDILYNYSYSNTTNNYTQETDYTNVAYPSSGSIGNNPGTDKETDISVDYTQPVTKNFTIETGAKAVIEDLNNTVNTQTLTDNGYVPNPSQTYGFVYDRKIFSYYLSSNFSLFNNFIDGKAGLRYEYTTSTSETTSASDNQNTTVPSYGILAPSFVLSHKLDKTESIKFSYSYRLQRPNYQNLDPFINVADPHNISFGDPNLKPELGHNFELGYNKLFDKGGNIYIAAFYRYNTNDLQSITNVYSNYTVGDNTYSNVAVTEQYNLGREVNEGVNLFGSLPIGKLTLRSNMFVSDRISSNPGYAQVSGIAYRANLNTSYDFGNDFAGEFFINYRSSQRGIQGTNPGFVFYNFAFRKQIMNKKASIGLTAANPFNQYVNVNTTTYGGNFNESNLREIPLRSFGISLMYKFGKMEFKKDKPKDDNGNGPGNDDPTSGGNR